MRRDNHCLSILVYVLVAVIIGSWLASAACGQDWAPVPPTRQSGLPGLLGELEDRMPAEHIYRDADRITWAHETTHGLNSRIRNEAGPGRNAVYLYGCGAVVLKEPPVTIEQVAAAVKSRGRLYDLYLVKQRGDWNNQPLYIVDEMFAYINGAVVGYEWGHPDTVGEHENAVEMYRYVRVLYDILLPMHPDRYDLRPLDALIRQAHEYLTTIVPYAGQQVSQVRCGPGGCGPSGCGPTGQPTGQPAWKGSGLFGRLRFQRAMPKFPCHRQQVIINTVPGPGTRPPPVLPHPIPPEPPPMVAVPPEDIPPESAVVTIEQLDSLRDELLAAIAAIPAGRTGDTGQQGEKGLQGERGPEGPPGPVPGVDYVPNFDTPIGRLHLDLLAEAVAKRLPAMIFQAKTPDGELYGDPVPKRLGETVFLKTPKGE